jgi:uncharacterized damage-inducible protein DinB
MQNNESQNSATYFRKQYELVKESRKRLLDYCAEISNGDFTKDNNSFGISSVRDLLVHVANSSRAWLCRALKKEIIIVHNKKIRNIDEVRKLYAEVDDLMGQFIEIIAQENPEILEFERNGKNMRIRPMRLFSHVATHEFHHKGQILSLSRHLGYTPVDTDIIL